MGKRGIHAVIVIVAAVAMGAAVFIAAGTPQGTTTAQDLSGTLEGLEAEQRGETIPVINRQMNLAQGRHTLPGQILQERLVATILPTAPQPM